MNSAPHHDSTFIASAWKIWLNPIFLRYCRSRMRIASLLAFGGIVLMITGFIFWLSIELGHSLSHHEVFHVTQIDVARAPIIPLFIFQCFILFVLGTAQVSGGMVAERDENVIDYQRLIPMSPASKTLGYLFGLPVREYLLALIPMPFMLWCFIFGKIPWQSCLSMYGVMLSTALIYHFTGLLTGMVVRNRRWAFLTSMGFVLLIYTVMPQLSKFGLPYFKYLTVIPVFEEVMPSLLPSNAGSLIQVVKNFSSNISFFGLNMPEIVFTWFSQGSLIITFFVMLCRRWKRQESHLLNQVWAISFFAWLLLVMIGNALPLIDEGLLFPSMELKRKMSNFFVEKIPHWGDVLGVSVIFGVTALILNLVLTSIITPSYLTQVNSIRLADKWHHGKIRWFSETWTSLPISLGMAIIGGATWFWLTKAMVDSHWFPSHTLPWWKIGYFILASVNAVTLFQLTMERKSAKFAILFIVILGIAPLITAGIVNISHAKIAPWIASFSPISTFLFVPMSELSLVKLPLWAEKSIPVICHFSLFLHSILAIFLFFSVRKVRDQLSDTAVSN